MVLVKGEKMSKPENKYFQSSESKLYSTVYIRVYNQAQDYYESLIQNPKRKPYVKSKYFDSKVFIDEFWVQLLSRNLGDRRRRLVFYKCAIDLIKNSRFEPQIKTKSGQKYYEFLGHTKDGEMFAVHIRENSRGGLYFMSCFPL